MPAKKDASVDAAAPAVLSCRPLCAALDQLAQVIATLSDEQYTRRPSPHFDNNVAGHVRHSLDHIEALLGAIGTGVACYDQRQRGTEVESDRGAALGAMDRITERLVSCSPLVARLWLVAEP